jgi:ATP-binding cassette, subfamily B, multidrug efflux pump
MFDVLFKLKWFFKEHWKRYTVAIVIMMLTSVVEIIPPVLIGGAIDEMTTGAMTEDRLLYYVGLFIFMIIFMYVGNFVWQYQLFGGSITLEKVLRRRLMHQFLKMTPSFYEKNRTGDLMARATNDLNAVSLTAGFGIMTLIDSTFYLIAIIIAMGMFVSWKLTLLAMIPIPIMAYAMQVIGKVVHERFMTAQDAFGGLNDDVLESVAGVRVVRAYVQEEADEKRFADHSEEVFKKNMDVVKVNALFMPLTKIGTSICYLVAFGYGAVLVSNNDLTVGQLVTFTVFLGLAIWPMFAIGELINTLQQGNASLDRVHETLDTVDAVLNAEKTKSVDTPTSIGFDEFTFQYPLSQVQNLKQISLNVPKGHTLGIVGKTGAGKTTFIRQLLRQYPLGEGEITIGGVNLSQLPKEEVLDWIGYVPQDHVLFSRSIRDNIKFGKEDASEEDIREAIRLAYFEKDLEVLPQGIETMVGEKGVSLSGGQKQRVSIARALIKNPEILILDDSLSAVDAKTEAKIIENIQNERAGKTTIIATHRLSGIQHAEHIIVIDNGEVVEEGTHESLVALGGWYKEQYDRQQLGEVE